MSAKRRCAAVRRRVVPMVPEPTAPSVVAHDLERLERGRLGREASGDFGKDAAGDDRRELGDQVRIAETVVAPRLDRQVGRTRRLARRRTVRGRATRTSRSARRRGRRYDVGHDDDRRRGAADGTRRERRQLVDDARSGTDGDDPQIRTGDDHRARSAATIDDCRVDVDVEDAMHCSPASRAEPPCRSTSSVPVRTPIVSVRPSTRSIASRTCSTTASVTGRTTTASGVPAACSYNENHDLVDGRCRLEEREPVSPHRDHAGEPGSCIGRSPQSSPIRRRTFTWPSVPRQVAVVSYQRPPSSTWRHDARPARPVRPVRPDVRRSRRRPALAPNSIQGRSGRRRRSCRRHARLEVGGRGRPDGRVDVRRDHAEHLGRDHAAGGVRSQRRHRLGRPGGAWCAGVRPERADAGRSRPVSSASTATTSTSSRCRTARPTRPRACCWSTTSTPTRR